MIFVYLGLNIFLLMGVILAIIFHKEKLHSTKKKDIRSLVFPLAHSLVTYLHLTKLYEKKDKLKDSLQQLQVSEKGKELLEDYVTKKVSMIILILFGLNSLCFLYEASILGKVKLQEGRYIKSSTLAEELVDVEVYVKDDTDYDTNERYLSNIELELSNEQNLTSIPEEVVEVKNYIVKTLLGENESYSDIYHPLHMALDSPHNSVWVEWELDQKGYVNTDGSVNNTELTEAVDTKVTALLVYEGTTYRYEQPITIRPYKQFLDQQLLVKIHESLNVALEKATEEEYLTLPETANDQQITWREKRNTTGLQLFIIGLLLSITVFFLQDNEVKQQIKKRNQQMIMDYPEIINKFTLLLRAGMTLKGAFERIIDDYMSYEKNCKREKKNNNTKRYVYEEMQITYSQLKLGRSEIEAYENFGKRIKLLPYMRFSSLISQNVKKGTQELIPLLELEAIEAFSERKELAKRLGEEAGTKLLIPMLGMLVIVLIIIMVPALMSF